MCGKRMRRMLAGLLLLALLTGSAFAQETAPVERTAPKYLYQDLRDVYLRGTGTNTMLVVFLGYKDGLACDREALELLFTGEFDSEHRLGSVASYYGYNSYGKTDFDIRFVYLDTGMTCRQGYENAGRNHERYYTQLFNRAKKAYRGDVRDLDRDGDGFADLVVFIGGEDTLKTVGDGERYYIGGNGSMGQRKARKNRYDPEMCLYIRVAYEPMLKELIPANPYSGARVLLHEIGHAFGLMDYYDTEGYQDEWIDSVGTFDMQSYDIGDWNPYSKMACGWLEPYVIPEDAESVTLKLGCSSEVGDAVLIPTSLGWNGTPFDEYILIDVMAPEGGNGYDWEWAMDERQVAPDDPGKDGGVRIYHVDARLELQDMRHAKYVSTPAFTFEEIESALKGRSYGKDFQLYHMHVNSNGYEPKLEADSRWYHLVELVPRDGTGKYRVTTPTNWSAFHFFAVNDLFRPGDSFSMRTHADAFPNAPYMNNGGTLDWTVTVDAYDPETHEAVVTVRRGKE